MTLSLISQKNTEGISPSPRSGHGAANVRDTLCVFGGWNGHKVFNDLHTLTPLTNHPLSGRKEDPEAVSFRWTRIDCNNLPSPRAFMTFYSIAGKILLFGGRDENLNSFKDAWILSPVSGGEVQRSEQVLLQVEGMGEGAFKGRRGHATAVLNAPGKSVAYLVGGKPNHKEVLRLEIKKRTKWCLAHYLSATKMNSIFGHSHFKTAVQMHYGL